MFITLTPHKEGGMKVAMVRAGEYGSAENFGLEFRRPREFRQIPQFTLESVKEHIPEGVLSDRTKDWLENLLKNSGLFKRRQEAVMYLFIDGGKDTILLLVRLTSEVLGQPFIRESKVIGMVNGEEVDMNYTKPQDTYLEFCEPLIDVLWGSSDWPEQYKDLLTFIRVGYNRPAFFRRDMVIQYVPDNLLSDKVRDWLQGRRVETYAGVTAEYLFAVKGEDTILLLIEQRGAGYSDGLYPLDGYKVVGMVNGEEVASACWGYFEGSPRTGIDSVEAKIAGVERGGGDAVLLETASGHLFTKTLTKVAEESDT